MLAISRRWQQPEQAFKAWHRGETAQPFALGEVQLVQVEPSLWIANLASTGWRRSTEPNPPICYGAIATLPAIRIGSGARVVRMQYATLRRRVRVTAVSQS